MLVGASAWTDDGFTPFVLACFALAAGSAAYHQWHDDAKRGYWAHHADELGMYMVFSSLVLAMVGLHVWWLAVITWVILHFVALTFNAHQVLAVLASMLAGAMLQTGMYWQTLLAVGLFAGAYFVRSLDHAQYGWAHAGWHVWTGILITVVYQAVTSDL